jgi:hypothetical protein
MVRNGPGNPFCVLSPLLMKSIIRGRVRWSVMAAPVKSPIPVYLPRVRYAEATLRDGFLPADPWSPQEYQSTTRTRR